MAEANRKQTRGIRVPDDLAEMLSWIVEIEGGTVAEIVNGVARPEIERRYARIASRVEAIKVAKSGPVEPAFVNELAPDIGGEG